MVYDGRNRKLAESREVTGLQKKRSRVKCEDINFLLEVMFYLSMWTQISINAKVNLTFNICLV